MTARHLDLVVSAGETLNYGLRMHTAGVMVRLDELDAGAWVFYRGDPWPVHAVEDRPDGTVRVRLGRGQFWEPDVVARADTTALEAPPATILTHDVRYRSPDGSWRPLPAGVAASGTEIRLLPHDAASETFTASLAGLLEAGGAASTEWQAVATFVELPGRRRLAEGSLAVVSGYPLVVPAPVSSSSSTSTSSRSSSYARR